jgi:hypothetical protein
MIFYSDKPQFITLGNSKAKIFSNNVICFGLLLLFLFILFVYLRDIYFCYENFDEEHPEGMSTRLERYKKSFEECRQNKYAKMQEYSGLENRIDFYKNQINSFEQSLNSCKLSGTNNCYPCPPQ